MGNTISLSHRGEYWLIRFLETILRLFPRNIVLALGAGLGDCLYHLKVYRSVVEKNMDHVGLFDAQRKKEIIKNLYRNTGRIFADFLRSSDTPPPHFVNNFPAAKAIFSRGKGSIVVLAHFGNWEVLASVFGLRLYDLNVLTKPMKNKLVEKWLLAKRTRTHVTPIYFSQALRKMLAIIHRGGIIAMLIDQYAGGQGSAAPFLGKTANTVRAVAGLLQKTGCGIVFAYALLQKDNTYRIEIEEGPVLPVPPKDDRFIPAYLQAHNEVLSRWIIEHPDHYFGWFHRRFKDYLSY
jgi:Kdo2-lipid IVA lauroyltransferase/acyltransferase